MYLEFIIIYNFVSNLNLGNKFKFELTNVRVICLVYFCSQLEYNFLEDRDRDRESIKEFLTILGSIVSQTTCNLNHPSFLPVPLKLHERYGFPVSL